MEKNNIIFIQPYTDITFCKGKNCPIRDKCVRYVFGLNQRGPAMWFTHSHYHKRNKSCPYYKGN